MAGKTIGRNTNVNDGTDVTTPVLHDGPFTLNTSTSIKIADANAFRIYFNIGNASNKNIKMFYAPAGVINDNTIGINVWARTDREMTSDNWYTGEISAIAVNGTPEVTIVEY